MRARWQWVAIVVPLWLVLVACTHWEPIIRDGWGHFVWHRHFSTTIENLWDFAKGSYIHNNPRLGQIITLLLFTPGPWHELVTPLVELALFWLLTTLALGRWPSFDRSDDALLFASIVAMVGLCAPSLGPMLAYRPFTGNYVFGFFLNVALLVPYRLHAEEPRGRWWWTPGMLLLGGAAGLCNEHTGPAVAGLLGLALVAFWRRGERWVPWAVAGLVGMLVGSYALLVAPGQDIRYNGLATQQTMFERIAERGVLGNGRIVGALVLYLLPAVMWLVLAMAARRRDGAGEASRTRQVVEIAGIAAALAVALTLLLSPKQGARLYFAPVAFACTAIAGWVVPQLVARWSRRVAAAMAAAGMLWIAAHLLYTYRVLGIEFDARLAAIETAQPGATVVVLPYSVKRSKWALMDDFEADTVRRSVAAEFGLAAIELDRTQSRVATPVVPEEP